MKTLIYIVRHCEAAGNKERFFQGQMDGGISELGGIQLEYLAERFRIIHIDAVYSSPLFRAMSTARAVNKHHGLDIIPDSRLMEINGGEWEGKRWADLPSLYPKEAEDWVKAPHLFCPPGGERMPDVQARMISAVTEIAARHEGQAVAVCSHGCAIRCLTCWAMGFPLDRLREVGWCDNTAVMLLGIDCGEHDGADIIPDIIYENDISHLPEEYSTFARQLWWKNKDEMNFDQ